jgi:hypothetical protein
VHQVGNNKLIVSDQICKENQNTPFVFSNFFLNCAIYEKMWKVIIEGAGHRWQYGASSLHVGYVRPQIHTVRLCNTHCFSTATVVA